MVCAPIRALGAHVLDGNRVDHIVLAKGGDDFETLERGSEDRVSRIKPVLGTEAEVELRASGIGSGRTCHGQGTIYV